MLARAVAREAGVAFLSCSASDFVEMLVGRGAARVRDLFQRAAKQKGPAIIFIDELDALGKARGGLNSHDEREQTLNQLLTEMDGARAKIKYPPTRGSRGVVLGQRTLRFLLQVSLPNDAVPLPCGAGHNSQLERATSLRCVSYCRFRECH